MNYPIPKDALDERFAIVGTAGSGKTYLTLGAIEHLFSRKSRVIGIDPLGVMWGLRLCEDGKTPSPYQPIIFGGSHGDLPINEHAGALVGESVATMRESCILDLSALGTKAAERRFMLAFLTALYRHTDKEPVHLIVDEADMFAPQKLMDKEGDAAKLLGMMETIVRRGRVKGFIPWLITQRPAVLSKDILSQADGIVALKLTSSQDRDAIGAWIEGQADKGEGRAILASLPTKQRGEGVLWIPALGILREVAFPKKATFDSSRTPKRGEKREARELKPLDLGRLKDRLAAVETEAKANDPKALKLEVLRLNRELAAKPSTSATKTEAAALKACEAAFTAGTAEGYAAGWSDGDRGGFVRGVTAAHGAVKAALATIGNVEYVASAPPKRALGSIAQPVVPPITARSVVAATRTLTAVPSGLGTPQARVMQSLAFWRSIGHDSPTREQVAAVAGYRPGSGNFNNLVGGLSTQGYTSVPAPGRLRLESDFNSLTHAEAKAKLLSVFDNPQRRLVDAAIASNADLSRDELAVNAGYAPGSGNFNNIAGSLTSMDVLQRSGQGRLQISDWAREVLS